MVGLGGAKVRTARRYKHGIKRLNTLFPGRWGLILSTDAIVRTERWTQLREEAEEKRPLAMIPACRGTGLSTSQPTEFRA